MQDELFEKVNKSTLLNQQGLSYQEFRKTLTPKWGVVWFQISMAWFTLLFFALMIILLSGQNLTMDLLLAIFGSFVIGCCVAYLMLFFHEASHYNIHPDRKTNDLLCNIFLGGIVGMEIKRYRPIHWDHHRYLGTPKDAEISYFDRLSPKFLLEALFGIRALRVILQRKAKIASGESTLLDTTENLPAPYTLVGSLIFNFSLMAILLYFKQWPLMFAWAGGILVWFPFFSTLRQLLEHRDENANPNADFTQVNHGAIHRLFGDGPVASIFGGAGFNRHLLHHLEPQLSYTRLQDLENFLMDTEAAEFLQQHSTTYGQTFQRLFQSNWR